MNKYLIVLLESRHRSFCYYEIPENIENIVISREDLEKVVTFSQENNVPLTFVYGESELPSDYVQLIETVEHVKIFPHGYPEKKDGIRVFEPGDKPELPRSENEIPAPIILRTDKSRLDSFADSLENLSGGFSRMNFILRGLEAFQEDDFIRYFEVLNHAVSKIPRIFQTFGEKEISCLTDRIVLKEMNNCDAGVRHLTLAPNGRLYVCPGFYYEYPEEDLGTLDSFEVPNEQLYRLDHAPICLECDAFHCKRCVFLNRKITGEVNTPGREQCLASHLERRGAEILASRLNPRTEANPIPPIDYLDPFEKYAKKKNITPPHTRYTSLEAALEVPPLPEDPRKATVREAGIGRKPVDRTRDKEIIKQVYDMQSKILTMQEEILDLLKYIRGK
jgi:CXXX repeat peptide maturase